MTYGRGDVSEKWEYLCGFGLTENQVYVLGRILDGDRLVKDSVWRINGGSNRRGGHTTIYRWNEVYWGTVANIATIRVLERRGFIRKLKDKLHCFNVIRKAIKPPKLDTLDPEANRTRKQFPDTGNAARPYRVVPMLSRKTRGGDYCYRSSILDADDIVVRRSACSPEAPSMFKEAHRLNDVHEKGFLAGQEAS